MPEWTENALLLALVAAVATLIQQLINRTTRKYEVEATGNDNLVIRMGEQLDRLEKAQAEDRRRIDWLEDELWGERHYSHKLHSGLAVVLPWGESVIRWASGDRKTPLPSPPDFSVLRNLLDAPRPRRPPPKADST